MTKEYMQMIKCNVSMSGVNTQAQIHAQIHTYTQIPAYVQLPTLFQPRVPSQPSVHLCCNQAPGPAMISIDPLVSAKTLIIARRLCIISVDSNEVATFYPFGPMHPGNWKPAILEGLFSITSSHLFLTPSSHPSLFQHT